MQEQHLAIASVPIQKWGPLFEDGEALKIGTVFKDLDKPFFASSTDMEADETKQSSVPEEQKQREEMMTKIMEISFALDDLALYLDTHDKDQQALQMYLEKSQLRTKLKQEFAEHFYPLTRDCVLYGKEEGRFNWLEGPMPWEGACV